LIGVEIGAAAVLAVLALWVILQPLAQPALREAAPMEPLEPDETPTGIALTALKEIEFDRETGKLSPADYEQLKAKYTAAAVAAMRAAEPDGAPDDVEGMIAAKVRLIRSAQTSTAPDTPTCRVCGPRPEPDAIFCSTCGARLQVPTSCASCGATLPPDSNFCESCGTRVAA
jgi:rRNA maturation endonuclease Nob1